VYRRGAAKDWQRAPQHWTGFWVLMVDRFVLEIVFSFLCREAQIPVYYPIVLRQPLDDRSLTGHAVPILFVIVPFNFVNIQIHSDLFSVHPYVIVTFLSIQSLYCSNNMADLFINNLLPSYALGDYMLGCSKIGLNSKIGLKHKIGLIC
jgi:hypothetical protein